MRRSDFFVVFHAKPQAVYLTLLNIVPKVVDKP